MTLQSAEEYVLSPILLRRFDEFEALNLSLQSGYCNRSNARVYFT